MHKKNFLINKEKGIYEPNLFSIKRTLLNHLMQPITTGFSSLISTFWQRNYMCQTEQVCNKTQILDKTIPRLRKQIILQKKRRA
jgi:hypothetical protein